MAAVIIFLFVFVLFISFYFSGSEAAFLSLNMVTYRSELAVGERKAILIKPLLEARDKTLSVLLFGNNLANIAAANLSVHICIFYVTRQSPWLPFRLSSQIL